MPLFALQQSTLHLEHHLRSFLTFYTEESRYDPNKSATADPKEDWSRAANYIHDFIGWGCNRYQRPRAGKMADLILNIVSSSSFAPVYRRAAELYIRSPHIGIQERTAFILWDAAEHNLDKKAVIDWREVISTTLARIENPQQGQMDFFWFISGLAMTDQHGKVTAGLSERVGKLKQNQQHEQAGKFARMLMMTRLGPPATLDRSP